MDSPSAAATNGKSAPGGVGRARKSLSLSKGASRLRWAGSLLIHGALFCVTAVSAVAVILIFVFVARDAVPFFAPEDEAVAFGRGVAAEALAATAPAAAREALATRLAGEFAKAVAGVEEASRSRKLTEVEREKAVVEAVTAGAGPGAPGADLAALVARGVQRHGTRVSTAWGRIKEFFAESRWYPSGHPPLFGTLSMFVGSALVTLGAAVVAVPLGVCAAVCLSDIMPFGVRQYVKPVIEMLAAIPSVAYGFFALVIVAPLLQERGGALLSAGAWMVGAPVALLAALVASDVVASRVAERRRFGARLVSFTLLATGAGWGLWKLAATLSGVQVTSGTNAFNVSVILGVMALPTVVSVSEDALQAVGGGLREGSYALGSTRAETLARVVIPAASSGIMAAAILGVMRAVGETMVVWMASGNAAQIPTPWYNLMQPVRTLTATIAGDMGEADHVTGSARYSVLFAMALCLVTISFALNLASEWAIRRAKRRLG